MGLAGQCNQDSSLHPEQFMGHRSTPMRSIAPEGYGPRCGSAIAVAIENDRHDQHYDQPLLASPCGHCIQRGS
jgi:hypothetical protein